jgi:transposase
MNAREMRGQQLVAAGRIQPIKIGTPGRYVVRSQNANGQYYVDLNSARRCTCPDFELRQCKCKHIFAVEYFIKRQRETVTDANGQTTVTETITKTKRTTYKQDWPAYNAAQTTEKATFQIMLHDLCKGVPEPLQVIGRRRLSLADMIFVSAFKVFSTVSGRRFMSDCADAEAKGYIAKTPHFNSIFNYLEMPELTPILHKLIQRSSLPLKGLETSFAVDSSGFSTARNDKWFETKYGPGKDYRGWVKVHLMCGVKTNIVTSVMLTGAYAGDSNSFVPLVEATAQNGFNLRSVTADKAYSGRKNLQAVDELGGTAYIPFKENARGTAGNCELWRKMFHYYRFNRDDFLSHYHERSNVESTFSMIKAKFGGKLRSKTDTAITNEALCKILCHNICCLIQSMYEFGIDLNLT